MKQQNRTKEEMYPLVEAYLEVKGTVTVREFSTSHGIPEGVFTYWLGKYRRQMVPANQFVELSGSLDPSDSQPLVELLYPGGIRLRMFVPVGPHYLHALVNSDAQKR